MTRLWGESLNTEAYMAVSCRLLIDEVDFDFDFYILTA
jgi:hypothetical protein